MDTRFDAQRLTESTFRVVGSSDVQVTGYKETYASLFPNNQSFIQRMSAQFCSALQTASPSTKMECKSEIDVLPAQLNSLNDTTLATARNFFGSVPEQYVINLTDIHVGEQLDISFVGPTYVGGGAMVGGGMGGGMAMGGGTSSHGYCVIDVNVQIWDVKNQKKVLEFMSEGKASQNLFFFEGTFKNAMQLAVDRAVGYLQKGQMEFRNE